MKKLLIGSAIAAVLLLDFFLFEPIFVYNFGWRPFTAEHSHAREIIYDSSLENSITCARAFLEDSLTLETPALSVAVGMDGKLVWASASGLANMDDEIEATPATAFRIGSTSKAVTSVGLGILLEQQRLALHDTVPSEILDQGITISQLASHTSGIRNYGMCLCFPVWEYHNNDAYSSVEEAVAIFRDDPLLFDPGTNFSYSSYNFTALSAVMEHAAGTSFTQFMENNVFRKSGMNNTAFDHQQVSIERAEFYDLKEAEYKKAFPVDNSNKWAGGGMISTPSDLVNLGNSILTGEIIKNETFHKLTEPVKLTTGEVNEQNYAIGWRVSELDLLDKKVKVIHHGGTAAGSTTLWIIIPAYNLTAAIMINRSVEGFPLFDILIPVAEAFIGDSEVNENK